MRAAIYLSAVVALGAAGCCGSFRDWVAGSHKPGTVETPKITPASLEASKRVDKVGRKLLAGSEYLGTEVLFHTAGFSEPEMYHQDAHGLFITEGLVNLCKTDDQLAAVLATELGHMAAEARRRERMRLPEPIPTAARGPKLDGSTDFDPGRDMEAALLDKQFRKPSERANWPSIDPKALTAGILKDAGVPPECAAEVAPMLKAAQRNHALAKQFGGTPEVPRMFE